jgi:hypothetical protein
MKKNALWLLLDVHNATERLKTKKCNDKITLKTHYINIKWNEK